MCVDFAHECHRALCIGWLQPEANNGWGKPTAKSMSEHLKDTHRTLKMVKNTPQKGMDSIIWRVSLMPHATIRLCKCPPLCLVAKCPADSIILGACGNYRKQLESCWRKQVKPAPGLGFLDQILIASVVYRVPAPFTPCLTLWNPSETLSQNTFCWAFYHSEKNNQHSSHPYQHFFFVI